MLLWTLGEETAFVFLLSDRSASVFTWRSSVHFSLPSNHTSCFRPPSHYLFPQRQQHKFLFFKFLKKEKFSTRKRKKEGEAINSCPKILTLWKMRVKGWKCLLRFCNIVERMNISKNLDFHLQPTEKKNGHNFVH